MEEAQNNGQEPIKVQKIEYMIKEEKPQDEEDENIFPGQIERKQTSRFQGEIIDFRKGKNQVNHQSEKAIEPVMN